MSLKKPNRRTLMKLAALAPTLALPASAARADITAPHAGQPAFHRFSLGQANITVVSDGFLELPASSLGVNADRKEVADFLSAHYLSPEVNYAHTNHVVIELGGHVVLVDIGSGDRFLKSAGRLLGNLKTAGIDPASITHVVITHAHPDHVWGIRDDFDEVILPDAAFTIGAAEYDWWMTDDRVNTVPQGLQQFVAGAVNSLSTEGLEWNLAQDGHELVPGVTLIASPGHTPGHMSVMVESDGNQMLVLGDSMTHGAISFEHPEWVGGSDMDPDQTVATRKRLLDMAASERMTLVGYHFPFPGVGHVMRDQGKYRFLPALWKWQA